MKYTIFAVVGVIIFSAGWWLFSPYFINEIVSEELTVNLPTDSITGVSIDPTEFNTLEQPQISDEPEADSSAIPEPSTNTVTIESEVVEELLSGTFIDGGGSYTSSGQVYISGNDLSIANLNSTNVPDGRVYLSNGTNASDFIDIGSLKGNIGDQNYKIPDGINAENYSHVLIWCRAFSVLVGSAEIN